MPETYPKGRTTKVPISVMPIIDVPFKRVAIDLVGPIEPRTKNGNRYILCFVDFATRAIQKQLHSRELKLNK